MTSRFFETPFSRSLALHLFFLMLLFCYVSQIKGPFFAEPPVEVTVIEPNKEKKLTEIDRNRTVVRRSQGRETDIAKKDSYLSDKTRTVEEEQTARNSGEAAPLPVINPKAVQQTETQKHKAAVKLSDLGIKMIPEVKPDHEEEKKWASSQTGEVLQGGQYIHGLKEGETSALNTKEFVFYSYFERVRRQLDQAWQPMIRENIHKIYFKKQQNRS